MLHNRNDLKVTHIFHVIDCHVKIKIVSTKTWARTIFDEILLFKFLPKTFFVASRSQCVKCSQLKVFVDVICDDAIWKPKLCKCIFLVHVMQWLSSLKFQPEFKVQNFKFETKNVSACLVHQITNLSWHSLCVQLVHSSLHIHQIHRRTTTSNICLWNTTDLA